MHAEIPVQAGLMGANRTRGEGGLTGAVEALHFVIDSKSLSSRVLSDGIIQAS